MSTMQIAPVTPEVDESTYLTKGLLPGLCPFFQAQLDTKQALQVRNS